MKPKGAVEAALFSSPQGLRVKEISDKTGLSEDAVRGALKALASEYDERESAITVIKVGPEYHMKLREEYTDYAGEFAAAEMTKGTRRTLMVIAYNQPVLQSDLCKNLGSRVYDDVRDLFDFGFIQGKKSGQTIELTTTKKFCEHFGINGTKREVIRAWMDERQKQ